MRVIIDWFEGEFTVCETDDRTMVNIERSQVPAAVGMFHRVKASIINSTIAEGSSRLWG